MSDGLHSDLWAGRASAGCTDQPLVAQPYAAHRAWWFLPCCNLTHKAAVRAGLTWSINNGMVEGLVTKLKLIKRQMYGKAGFALLRQRVLHAL